MSPAASLPKKRMRFANRALDSGMGKAVAQRTYLRKITDPTTGRERWETWQEVAERVALGNSLLIKNFEGVKNAKKHQQAEYELLQKHINNGSMLMSGRH